MFLKFMKIIKVFSNPRLFKILLSMNYNGYLKEIGWIESFKMKMPVDKDLKPIPWMTYPFIDFISDKFSPDMEIFEYGSGNSTLYFASKVKGVIVLDNSERTQNLEGIRFLLNAGFKKIDFWGISPGLFYKKSTTIFYTENNCLGIQIWR